MMNKIKHLYIELMTHEGDNFVLADPEIDIVMNALKKQIPKVPSRSKDGVIGVCKCGCCNNPIGAAWDYCVCCGQAIKGELK